jgi:prolyl oligopeptidase
VTYPITEKKEFVDNYFDTEVKDPYRWLEDDRSQETESWVKAENQTTLAYLKNISFRSDLKKRLEYIWNYEKISAPFKEGEFTYFYKNNGLQNQYVIFRQKENESPEVFFRS